MYTICDHFYKEIFTNNSEFVITNSNFINKFFKFRGLGVGSSPIELTRNGAVVDVVEIDNLVAKFAQKHFGFSTKGKIFIEDAIDFLNRESPNREKYYDGVIHDIFAGISFSNYNNEIYNDEIN